MLRSGKCCAGLAERQELKAADVPARLPADVAVTEGPLPLAAELDLLRVHLGSGA